MKPISRGVEEEVLETTIAEGLLFSGFLLTGSSPTLDAFLFFSRGKLVAIPFFLSVVLSFPVGTSGEAFFLSFGPVGAAILDNDGVLGAAPDGFCELLRRPYSLGSEGGGVLRC